MWYNNFTKGGTVREDKLGNFSMELSVKVLQLTKELLVKHENAMSNQISSWLRNA